MMKRGKTDSKIATKKTLKPEDLKRMKNKLKTRVYHRLLAKHNTSKSSYNDKVIDSLIFNKNTHFAVTFKDCMIIDFTDEFLKR